MVVTKFLQSVKVDAEVLLTPPSRCGPAASLALERRVTGAQDRLPQIFDAVRHMLQVRVIPRLEPFVTYT